MKQLRAETVVLLLVGLVLRFDGLGRPIDQPSWRECDLASIARNYQQHGLSEFAYPRVDWGGDGPGFAEMELPLLPWLMACSARWTGDLELTGRLYALAASIVALLAMAWLSTKLLNRWGAATALLMFALAPLPLKLSTAIHPDGPMLAASLVSVCFWCRWLDDDRKTALVAAAGGASLAVLLKAPAALLGIVFLTNLAWERGAAGFRDRRIYVVALAALAGPILWYAHAHQLWLAYGNSLGLSNESHWIGADVFRNGYMFRELLRIEAVEVWMPSTLAVVWLSFWDSSADKARRLAWSWLLAAAVFLVVAIRTTSDSYFDYYHILAVPPVALLFGIGCQELVQRGSARKSSLPWFVTGVAAATLFVGWAIHWTSGVVSGIVTPLVAWLLTGSLSRKSQSAALASPLEVAVRPTRIAHAALNLFLAVVSIGSVATPLAELAAWRRIRFTQPSAAYHDALRMRGQFTQDGWLVASGSSQFDHQGHGVAYQASYFFYWLDRPGFSLSAERHTLPEIERLIVRGARYLVVEQSQLADRPEFAEQLRSRFPRLDDGQTVQLYELTPLKASVEP